jgi:hypothetical protein
VTWDLAGIVQDARINFRTGLANAEDERRPKWSLGGEFRAVRNRSLLPRLRP